MAKKIKILYVEDNPHDVDRVRGLLNDRFKIKTTTATDEAYKLLTESRNQFDILLLDLNLNIDLRNERAGLDLLYSLQNRSNVLVVVFTGVPISDEDEEKIRYAGAHAFLRKQKMSMLPSILHSVMLTKEQIMLSDTCYTCNNIKLYPNRGYVEVDDEKVNLVGLQLKLLKYFILNKGLILNDEDIHRRLGQSISVENVIYRLRQALNDADEQQYIQTVKGEGYRLVDNFQPCGNSDDG